MPSTVLADTQALVNDALFRAGEIPGASEWDDKALEYINREYRSLCTGSSEFLPEVVSDWWWMRSTATLILDPVFNTGSVAVVQGSGSAVLSAPPAFSLVGYKLKSKDSPEVYDILTHTGGGTGITFDSVYIGPTNTAAGFTAMKTEYTLSSAVSSLIGPMAGYTQAERVYGLTPERMDDLFPLSELQPGIPQAFSLESDSVVRFSHGGRTDGRQIRLDYRYKAQVDDLTYNTSSIPLIPIQYRHVLSDMTLVYLYMDKNDDRLTAIGTSVRSLLGSMTLENRRRIAKMDQFAGHIFPRMSRNPRNYNRLLRTESGMIIG
jgi:hypothetical protein